MATPAAAGQPLPLATVAATIDGASGWASSSNKPVPQAAGQQ